MKQQSKLTREQQQEAAVEQQAQTKPAREFANAEELLRYDAAQVTVPPALAERLRKSAGDIPPPPRAWWRRFFQK